MKLILNVSVLDVLQNMRRECSPISLQLPLHTFTRIRVEPFAVAEVDLMHTMQPVILRNVAERAELPFCFRVATSCDRSRCCSFFVDWREAPSAARRHRTARSPVDLAFNTP